MIHFADYSSYRLAWKAEQKSMTCQNPSPIYLAADWEIQLNMGKLYTTECFSLDAPEKLVLDCLFIELLIGEHLLGMSIKTALSSQKTDRCCWPFNITALSLCFCDELSWINVFSLWSYKKFSCNVSSAFSSWLFCVCSDPDIVQLLWSALSDVSIGFATLPSPSWIQSDIH